MSRAGLYAIGFSACIGGIVTSIIYDFTESHKTVLRKVKVSHAIANGIRFLSVFLGFMSGGIFEYTFGPITKFLFLIASVVPMLC